MSNRGDEEREKKEEKKYQHTFINKYCISNLCVIEENKVDVIFQNKQKESVCYVEFKDKLVNDDKIKEALAQIVITNYKQKNRINKLAIAYNYKEGKDKVDVLKYFDISTLDLYSLDIDYENEKPSKPSFDAREKIFSNIQGSIITYYNNEIKEFYTKLVSSQEVKIDITFKNVQDVFSEWRENIRFTREDTEIIDSQELVNLFLTDALNNENYLIKQDENQDKNAPKGVLFAVDEDSGLIKNSMNLGKYKLQNEEDPFSILYDNFNHYFFADSVRYKAFWNKYKRPPSEDEFKKILERSGMIYTKKYRKKTGAFYTPPCFVEKQNELLSKFYGENWQDEYIVFDPCCGVGNLENDFTSEFKEKYCFMSTLEKLDVDIVRMKGFKNIKQFNYLQLDKMRSGEIDKEQPKFKISTSSEELNVADIAKKMNRKLMIIMNPPYRNEAGHSENLAIEFYDKVCKLRPDTIVFYYETESFFCDEIEHYIKSKMNIVSHIMSTAETFELSDWPISQVIFDKDKAKGERINKDEIKIDRYELDRIPKQDGKIGTEALTGKAKDDRLHLIKTYTYYPTKPNLIDEIEKKIVEHSTTGGGIGSWCYLQNVLNIGNGGKNRNNKITTNNLEYCLVSKGLSFDTDAKYFEYNDFCYKGTFEDLSEELKNDAIMMSLYYIGNFFSNKTKVNYLQPFKYEELGCGYNELNNLEWREATKNEEGASHVFDFREWFHKLKFSKEALELYKRALGVFKYYKKTYNDADWNDSFYDISVRIMQKGQCQELDRKDDDRIHKIKTTKGQTGFSEQALCKPNNQYITNDAVPTFKAFFEARTRLAEKINRQLVEAGLLLWERENIF